MPTSRIKAIITAQDKASPTFLKVGNAVKALGAAAAAVGAVQLGRVLVRGLGDAVTASKTFEQSMSRVSGLAGVTGGSLEKLKDQAKDLGRTTVFSAVQAADAMGEFAKAGFDAAEITGAIGPALKLAAAGQLELSAASSITSTVMRSMGKTTEELGNVVDVLASAATSANTTVEELGGGFKFVGATAKATGVAFEDVVAAMAALASAGIPVEQSASQLRNLFLEIKKNTEDNITTFGKFKLELFDTDGAFVGMAEALNRFQAAGINSSNVAQLFEKRLAAMLLAAMESREVIGDLEGSLRDVDGTAERLADTFLDNLGGAFTRMDSAVTGLKIEIGEKFQGALKIVIDEGVNPFINSLTDSIKESDGLRVSMLLTAASALRFSAAVADAVTANGLLAAVAKKTGESVAGLGTALNVINEVLAFRDAVNGAAGGSSAFSRQLRVMAEELEALARAGPAAADGTDDLGEGAKAAERHVRNLGAALQTIVADGPVLVDVFKRIAETAPPAFGTVDFSGALKAFDPAELLALEQAAAAVLLDARIDSENEWSKVREELEIERIEASFDRQIEAVQASAEAVADLEEAKELKITNTQKRFSNARRRIAQDEVVARFQLAAQLANQLARGSLAAFRVTQAAAIASAIVNTAQGVTKALAEYAWPFNIVVGAIVAAAGAAQIANIASASPATGFLHGGIVPGPTLGRDHIPINVDGGERIFSSSGNQELVAAINDQNSAPVLVEVNVVGSLNAAVEDINVLVRSGAGRLLASEIVSVRSTR